MKVKLFDLLIKTTYETKVLRALTDKEIVLLVAEKELTRELVWWRSKPAADAGMPIPSVKKSLTVDVTTLYSSYSSPHVSLSPV